jgi:hypothetical protein
MSGLLGRLLSIGADPGDDEDLRLRKVLLLVAALTIAPLAVLWGRRRRAAGWLPGADPAEIGLGEGASPAGGRVQDRREPMSLPAYLSRADAYP